jgi:hypothetical protein
MPVTLGYPEKPFATNGSTGKHLNIDQSLHSRLVVVPAMKDGQYSVILFEHVGLYA